MSRPRKRRAPGWVPNQHGAWAMLASPLLVGIIAAGPTWIHLPLAAFWFVGYFAFFAVSLWLKSGRKTRYLKPAQTYSLVAGVLALVLLAAQWRLVMWAPLFVVPLGVGLWAAAQRRERELLSGVTTAAGSALMTVVADAAGAHPDLGRAWLLAAVQAAYFVGTVFYVKSAIRERGNPRFLGLSVGFHAVCALAMTLVSGWLAGLFGLLTVRAWLVPPRLRSPKELGIGEIFATIAVAVVSLLTIT